MKKITCFLLFIYLCLVFLEINAHESSPTDIMGVYSKMIVQEQSILQDLYIDFDDIQYITGIDCHDLIHVEEHHDEDDHNSHNDHLSEHDHEVEKENLVDYLYQRKNKLLSHIVDHIKLYDQDSQFKTQLISIDVYDSSNLKIQLKHTSDENIRNFEFLYLFEPNYDKTDELYLEVVNQNRPNEISKVLHLHNYRKKMIWNSEMIKNEHYPFSTTIEVNRSLILISVCLGLVYILIYALSKGRD